MSKIPPIFKKPPSFNLLLSFEVLFVTHLFLFSPIFKFDMEILRPDSDEELTLIGENDQFYEEMEAPKFVDFTVPDHSKPGDQSWFCLRIGCDQQHEEVDPDALYRSFMRRVMAARSPNIKYQKALNKQAPRSIKKCPRTAPAKSIKDRVSRMSTMTSIPDRLANSKLKNHPVVSLRSTPTNTEAKVQPLRSEKALTTPRTKKRPSIHDSFLSVNHQKAPVPVSNNGSVAKALFLGTPKKTDEASKLKLLNSEVFDGMKELNIGSLKKKTVEVHLSGKKVEETSCMSLKKKNEGVVNTKNVEENLPKASVLVLKESQQSAKTDSTISTNSEDDSKQNTQALVVDNIDEYDGNTENDSSTRNANSSSTNSESESLQFVSNENIPQKQMRAVSKNSQEHGNQAAKVKRTTNPKPFRLRTNERGILKEANLEMKMKLEAQKEQKESASVLGLADEKHERGILKEANLVMKMKLEAQKEQKESASVLEHADEKHHNTTHENNHQVTSEGQKSQPNQTRTPRVRYVESRYASIYTCHKAEGKKTTESQNNIVKTYSSRQNQRAKSERSERKAELSRLKLANKPAVEDNFMENVTFLKGLHAPKSCTNFRRLHAPKSCTKCQGKVMA